MSTLFTNCVARDKNITIINKNYKKILIVRKPIFIPNNMELNSNLSPSEELFTKTKDWKNNIFTEEEITYLKKENIWEYVGFASNIWWYYFYEPAFKKELDNLNIELEKICDYLIKGIDIYLYCYCNDVEICHRKLVAIKIFYILYEKIFNSSSQNLELDYIINKLNSKKYFLNLL